MLGTAVSRLGLLLVTAGMTIPMHAALIEGVFNFRGTIQVTSDGAFDFLPLGGGQGNTVLGTLGFTEDFVGAEGTTGTLSDLNAPAPGPVNIPNFISLAARPSYAFTASGINAGIFGSGSCGTFPAAGGQTCTIPGGAVNFTNLTSGSSQASITMVGTVSDGSGDDPSDFYAIITATFSNLNYQTVLANIQAKIPMETSFAASVVVTPPTPGPVVPEPASMMAVGCGLAALGILGRRFRQN